MVGAEGAGDEKVRRSDMSLDTRPRAALATAEEPAARWLGAARVGAIVVALLSLAIFAAMTPAYFTLIQRVCATGECQLTAAQAQALTGLGFSLRDYAIFSVAVACVFELVSALVAAILFWRKAHEWMALLVALLLVALGNNNLTGVLSASAGSWRTPAIIIDNLDLALLILVFTLFPDGRFTPRWSRWLPLGWLATILPLSLLPNPLPDWTLGLLYLVFYASVIGAQIYRYRRISGPTQREQTKWVVFGAVVTLLANIALYQAFGLIPALHTPDSLFPVVAEALFHLVALLIPLSFGVAILRFRLYDIDLIINRAAVYGSLTTILAALYLGLVVGVQRAVSLVAHTNSSTFAIVISTLAISAAFQPLRRRLQRFIDRRFFRSKYDAAATVAAFSAALRSQTDLAAMRERLLDVVDETMRPATASLWLREPPVRI